MVSRLLWVGLAAGMIAGLLAAGVQAIGVWPLIAQAETFEAAGSVDEAWSPEGVVRTAWSVAFNLLAGAGFGLLANGALLILRCVRATRLDWRVGALVGVAGFLTFSLAPALGLAPALPGMAEGDLVARQVWWLATAAATLSGVVLFFLGRRTTDWILGVALIAAPHLVGAPGDGFGLLGLLAHSGTVGEGGMPAGLAQRFAIASLAAAAAFWLVLGVSSAWLQRRFLDLG